MTGDGSARADEVVACARISTVWLWQLVVAMLALFAMALLRSRPPHPINFLLHVPAVGPSRGPTAP